MFNGPETGKEEGEGASPPRRDLMEVTVLHPSRLSETEKALRFDDGTIWIFLGFQLRLRAHVDTILRGGGEESRVLQKNGNGDRDAHGVEADNGRDWCAQESELPGWDEGRRKGGERPLEAGTYVMSFRLPAASPQSARPVR